MRRIIRGLGYRLVRLSQLGRAAAIFDLAGDRDVEWSWVAANLPDRPGRVLDFGPSTATSGLIAAFRGATVTAVDLEAPELPFVHPGLTMRRGDLLALEFGDVRYDLVINCSTVEHVGLGGRYGSREEPDGDLRAMAKLRGLMAGEASRMLLTIPVGRDAIFTPVHRIYGRSRLPQLLRGYRAVREAYFAKDNAAARWHEVSRDQALAVEGSASFYALGLFVLAPV